MDRYQGMVTRIAYHYVRSRDDAEDICQEALIRWYLKKPKFRDGEQERAWMIRVTVNLCKNHLKAARLRRAVPLEDGREVPSPEPASVLEEVLALPEIYRPVVYLHYYEGYKTEEIARLLKRKHGTVLSQLSRARRLLKDELGGYENGQTAIYPGDRPSGAGRRCGQGETG